MIPLLYQLSYPASAIAAFAILPGAAMCQAPRRARLVFEAVLKRQKCCEVDCDKTNGSGAIIFHPCDLAGKFARLSAWRLQQPGELVLGLEALKSTNRKAAHRPIQGFEFPFSYRQFQMNVLHPGAFSPLAPKPPTSPQSK